MERAASGHHNARLAELGRDDLDDALRLSTDAGWNQTASDWLIFLELGAGWGLFAPDGELIGTVCVLPHGPRIAWVSMLIVHSLWRRRGLGRRLLTHCLGHLRRRTLVPLLDATPEGHTLYQRLGFRDLWITSRLAGVAPIHLPTDTATATIRQMRADDLEAVGHLECAAFGVPRTALLERLRQRLPGTALVCEEERVLRGYILGRDGRVACQLGPLVAKDDAAARALLQAALAGLRGPVYLDVPDSRSTTRESLARAGFHAQRRFTRMIRGGTAPPGNPDLLYAIAGPELG